MTYEVFDELSQKIETEMLCFKYVNNYYVIMIKSHIYL